MSFMLLRFIAGFALVAIMLMISIAARALETFGRRRKSPSVAPARGAPVLARVRHRQSWSRRAALVGLVAGSALLAWQNPARALSWPASSSKAGSPSCFAPPPPGHKPKRPDCVSETGLASWYGGDFHGRPTASGERYDRNAMTAAHPNLPMGAHVRVTHLRTGRTVVVRINDRGPFVRGRIIDLSARAALLLGMRQLGVARVRIERQVA